MSEDAGHFITLPPFGQNKDYSNNTVYSIGQIVTLSWVKGFSAGTLVLSQDNKPWDQTGGPSRDVIENEDIDSLEWAVSYMGMDPRVNNVFYLRFGDSGNGNNGFTSHYFNITGGKDDDSASTLTVAVTSFATLTPTPTFSNTTLLSAVPTSTLPTSTGSPSPTSLTAGGIASISVGVTLGTILVAGVLGLFCWNMRNRKKPPQNPTYDASQYPYPQTFVQVEGPHQLMSVPVVEMEGSQKPNGNDPHIWRHEVPSQAPEVS